MSAGANGAVGQNTAHSPRGRVRSLLEAGQSAQELREQIVQLRRDLDTERQRRFLRRLLGVRPAPQEDTEKTREKMRGRLAIGLVLALIALMVLTFLYLLILSRGFGRLTTDDLISLIPMVGTTLLTPLVGLIGAVMGFYYGGQTAVSAASQTAEATKQASQSASNTAAKAASSTAAQLVPDASLGGTTQDQT